MGEVYRAHDSRLGRDVAVKVLPPAVGRDPDRVRRFDTEARATAALSHPNILAVYDVGWHEDSPYLVTELLDGENLSQRIASSPVTVRDAVDITIQAAKALSFAHDHGIVHRDLKPGNLFLTNDGRLKVLDFGLARFSPQSSEEIGSLATVTDDPGTAEGTVLGTVGYMAPEQVRGEVADSRSDIFSLGVVLYELLAQRPPFARATRAETLSAVLRDDPPPLPPVTGDAGPALARIIARCLAKRPEDRFQSAHDLALALEAVSSPSWTESTSGEPQPNRRRAVLIAAVTVTVVLAVVLGVTLLRIIPSGGTPAGVAVEPAATPAPRPPQNRVAILPFVNKTGNQEKDPLSHSLAARVWSTVANVPDVDLVPMSTVDSALIADGADSESAVVEAVNAGIAVSGAIFAEGDGLRVQAVVRDIISGHVRPPAEAVCDTVQNSDCLDRLAVRVAEIVEMQVHVRELLLLLNRLPSYEAYRAMVVDNDEERGVALDPAIGILRRVFRAYDQYNRGESVEAAAAVQALLDDHGSLLSESGKHSTRGDRAFFEGNLPLALRQHRRASELEPSSLFFKAEVADTALAANRPLEMVAVFADVAPCDNYFGFKLIYAHLRAGDFEAAVEAARTFDACFPDRWWFIEQEEIMALAALGRVDEMEKALERCLTRHRGTSFAALTQPAQVMSLTQPAQVMSTASLELSARGDHVAARSLAERALASYRQALEAWQSQESAELTVDQELGMVEFLWRAGLEDEAVKLGKRLLESAPENLAVITWNGILAARRGDRVEAEKAAEEITGAGKTVNERANHTFNRACIAAQLGDTDRALDLLRQTVALGPFDFWNQMRVDPDLEPLRDHPAFQELLRPKG